EDFEAPSDARTTPDDPIMPLDAAQSVNSPLSIEQSAQDGVGLAGEPSVPDGKGVSIDDITQEVQKPVVELSSASSGEAHIFHVVDGLVLDDEQVTLDAGEDYEYTSPAVGKGMILI